MQSLIFRMYKYLGETKIDLAYNVETMRLESKFLSTSKVLFTKILYSLYTKYFALFHTGHALFGILQTECD